MKVLLIGSTGKLGKLILKTNLLFCGKLSAQNKERFVEFALKSDIILDVSHPGVTVGYLKKLTSMKKRIPYVVGCTGWTKGRLRILNEYSKRAPILVAPNFSLLVQLLAKFFNENSKLFSEFGYSISIEETHHIHKKDKPSGTAVMFAEIFKNSGINPKIKSNRRGNEIGTHEIVISGKKDTLLIKHEALNRELFAEGATFATRWLFQQSKKCRSGLFSMQNAIQKTV